MPSGSNKRELPTLLWLWLPVSLLLLQFIVRGIDGTTYRRVFIGERSLIENLTVLFLAIGFVTGLLLLRRRKDLPFPWMTPWLVVLCLGTFYFMGEEASWGQHWIGWSSPEHLAVINKQEETNLHNNIALEWWLDTLPRNLLSLAVGIGAVFVPLFRRGDRRWPASDARDWLWPTLVCLPAAAVASFLNVPERLFKLAGSEVPAALDVGIGESEEWALALVIMLYFLSFRARLRQQDAADDPSQGS